MAAFRTKLGPRLQHGRTRLALHLLRHLEPALRAELGAMRLRPALRAHELHLLAYVVPLSAALPFVIGSLRRAIDLALRPRARDRHLDIRRTIEAQAIRAIEALCAHVIVAIPAAIEMPLALLDRLLECRIARAVPAGFRHAVQHRPGIAEDAAEQAGALLQPAAGLGTAIGFERGAPPVAAALAIELELEAGVDAGGIAEVLDVTGELGFGRHVLIFPRGIVAGLNHGC